ncbi:MAG: NUDIX hydrolase [Calditrichia bacterium]
MREKPSYFYQQSGVIPFRLRDGKLEVMLITSRTRKRWIIPKGIIERDLSPAESAEMEAYEEAGIRGTLYPDLFGEYLLKKWGGTVKVQVFLLEVKKVFENWPEDSFRERKWVSIQEAIATVKNTRLKELFKLTEKLNREIPPSKGSND